MFRYFRDPHNFSTYSPEPHSCGICRAQRPGYNGQFYGAGELEFACEECLIAGRLAEGDFTANQADTDSLLKQLVALPTPDIENLVTKRNAEVEQATPHLVTWQDMLWPAHCGDYCCFLKGAGKADFQALTPDGDARAFFESHLYQNDNDTDLDFLWQSIRDDSPQNGNDTHDTEAYLFQCLECMEYVIRWDCN